jgi:hypothetical protein
MTRLSACASNEDIMNDKSDKQLLHLVIGGELESLKGHTFRDLDAVDLVGVYPNYAEAHDAWRGAAQRTVDNAHTRYFIVHLHRLMDPSDAEADADASADSGGD